MPFATASHHAKQASPDSSSTENVQLKTGTDKTISVESSTTPMRNARAKQPKSNNCLEFDHVHVFDQDEVVWKLDKIADSVREPTQKEPTVEETEDVKLNKKKDARRN